jgi:molecular chaperone GrpE
MDKEKEKKDKEEEQKDQEKEQDPIQDNSDGESEVEEDQPMVALTFDEYDALVKEIESLQVEVEEQKDGWLRARADLENYRKRVQRDAARSYQDAMTSVLKIFLDVADDLERALKNKPEGEAAEKWVEGIELIYDKLLKQMKNQGVERMEVNPGDEFDPNIHEAITQEDDPDFKEGQIIDIVQPGYRISDRIIRPAMVRVAR